MRLSYPARQPDTITLTLGIHYDKIVLERVLIFNI